MTCADELGDYQKALGYYKAAYDIDSTYLPTLVGRADLLFKMQDWDNAGKIYQTILVQHRDGQGEADVVRIAAARPAVPAALTILAAHPRWSVRHPVKRALVLNPSTPLADAIRIATTLRTQELRELSVDTSLREPLRVHAGEVYAAALRRPQA